jgi:DNA-binding response OmpR family regulator
MKNVLIANDLKDLIREQGIFLERAEITVFTAATNEEMLKICRDEAIDLIVTQLDLPGVRSEDFFKSIRKNTELKGVSTIIICEDTLANRERCKQCSPNAVVTLPVDPALLLIKVRQFLNIAPRRNYRAALAIAIEGNFKNTPLQFWTENISASGMLIKAEEPLAKGDGIFFSFFLPSGAHVSGYGEISRVERLQTAPEAFLYGIRFTNIAPSVKSAIESEVKK